MFLRQIFDPSLAQYSYLIGCQRTGEALVIDPERDIDRYRRIASGNDLRITAVTETHIHADFVSGAQEFAADPSVHLYLSEEGGPDWLYKWPGNRPGITWLKHGSRFSVGNIDIEAIHSPGHTPEHLSFLITDRGGGADVPMALATGDFLFVGDVGRPDLLETAAGVKGVREPSARLLWHSITERLPQLPETLQILPAHGAGSACGKALGAVPTSVLGYERRFNSALRLAAQGEEVFVKDILSGQPEPPLYFARMKKVNRDGVAVTGGPHLPPPVDASAIQRMIKDSRILDLRRDREAFSLGHLPGAVHAPFGTAFFLMAAGSYVREDESVLLVVDDDSIVEEAARQLYRIGLDHVKGFVLASEVPASFLEATPRILFDQWNHAAIDDSALILDVRNSSEFEAGHLPGALSIPYTRLRARLDEVPEDRLVYVHCGSGMRASLAASYLQSEGRKVVYVDGVCEACERIAQAQQVVH